MYSTLHSTLYSRKNLNINYKSSFDIGEKGYSVRSVRHTSQGVTKRCRLSWLTNSAVVYEPKSGVGGGGVQGLG
jgi:hypothetical protein